MDNLTHTLSGLIAGRLYPSNLPQKTRYVIAALAVNAPDLDIVLAPFSPELYLMHHRGISHSLLMAPLWAFLLSWLFARLFKSSRHWQDYYGLTLTGILLHIAFDWLTGYGTQLFAPISNHGFALGTTFIIDPVLTLILLLGVIISLWQRTSMWPARVATLAVVMWIGTQLFFRQEALVIGNKYAAALEWPRASVHVEPRPVAPFYWTIIIRSGAKYRYAHLNLHEHALIDAPAGANWFLHALSEFQPPSRSLWQPATLYGTNGADATLALEAWKQPALSFFRQFSTLPALYRIDHRPGGDCVWFEDLRFAIPERNNPFRFGVCGPDWAAYRLSGDGRAVPYH